MSKDRVTVTKHTSWFERIKGAFGGIVLGIILVLVSLGLLFWNEGRAIETDKKLIQAGSEVISVETDEIDPANNGKLIHIAGEAFTYDLLEDEIFKVQMSEYKMRRNVEMYQWIEQSESDTKKNLGGSEDTTTTYEYVRDWSPSFQDSSTFQQPEKHKNPETFPYGDADYAAKDVTMGAFILSRNELITKLNDYTPQTIQEDMLTYMPEEFREQATIRDTYIYLGNPDNPQIGDIRLSYDAVKQQPLSVIAEQNDEFLDTYRSKFGRIAMIQTGVASADEMIQQARDSNRFMTWLVRIGGFLLMMGGFTLILRPLPVLADVVPFIGSLVRFGTAIISATLAFAISLVTIAIAWFFFRPLLSALLIGVALAIGGGFYYMQRSRSKEKVEKRS